MAALKDKDPMSGSTQFTVVWTSVQILYALESAWMLAIALVNQVLLETHKTALPLLRLQREFCLSVNQLLCSSK